MAISIVVQAVGDDWRGSSVIDFVRRSSTKPGMWPRLVVPFDRCGEFLQERFASIGHERQPESKHLIVKMTLSTTAINRTLTQPARKQRLS